YAKRTDNDEVFLVPTSGASSFKKSLTDLRDKKVLNFETDNIDAIKIATTGKPELEVQKSGMDWRIKKPVDAAADAGEVVSFLSAIQFSRTSAFADEKVDAHASGIDTPSVKITLHDQKAGNDHALLFGKSPEKGKYYAKDSSRPAIFVLANEIIDKAQRPIMDWRDKSIVHLGEAGGSAKNEKKIFRRAGQTGGKKNGDDRGGAGRR